MTWCHLLITNEVVIYVCATYFVLLGNILQFFKLVLQYVLTSRVNSSLTIVLFQSFLGCDILLYPIAYYI